MSPGTFITGMNAPLLGGTLLSGMSDPRGHSVQSILSPFKEDTDHGVDSSHECPPLEGTGDTYSVEWCKRLHCPLGAIVPLPSNKNIYILFFNWSKMVGQWYLDRTFNPKAQVSPGQYPLGTSVLRTLVPGDTYSFYTGSPYSWAFYTCSTAAHTPSCLQWLSNGYVGFWVFSTHQCLLDNTHTITKYI